MNIEECTTAEARIARVREIVGGHGADLAMDRTGHPSAGPEGIEAAAARPAGAPHGHPRHTGRPTGRPPALFPLPRRENP